jgi:hypothetical protein
MFTRLYCTQCNKPGSLELMVKFLYQVKTCQHCHHLEPGDWSYNFCNLECMFKWFKEQQVEELGFPCLACVSCWGPIDKSQPTGFAFGSETHGICQVCNGNKRVKARKKETWEKIAE